MILLIITTIDRFFYDFKKVLIIISQVFLLLLKFEQNFGRRILLFDSKKIERKTIGILVL